MEFTYQRRGIAHALGTSHPAFIVPFLLTLLMFGLLIGFNYRIVLPSIVFAIFPTIVASIVNRTIIVNKPVGFWEKFGEDIEIILAYFDFLPNSKDGPVIYYQCRRPMILVPPILVVRRGSMVQINGPHVMMKVIARDIPALLEPETTQASP